MKSHPSTNGKVRKPGEEPDAESPEASDTPITGLNLHAVQSSIRPMHDDAIGPDRPLNRRNAPKTQQESDPVVRRRGAYNGYYAR